ncbi:MAG: diguanylate cyclase [Desulfococcaceae bacterium]
MAEEKPDRETILIVDDVPKNIQLVANILKGEGYSLAFAQSGEKALDLTASASLDLILLDIMMPGMDGFEVCRRLKADPILREVPVLFLTAKTDTESVVQGFEVGAQDYVMKPVKETELLARVRTHLTLYRTHKTMRAMNRRLQEEIHERRAAEQRYRSMYENALQGMFQTTLEGRMVSFNPAFARILGYEAAEELMAVEDVSQAFYDRPEDRNDMLERLERDGFLSDFELKVRRRDGAAAWLVVNARLAEEEGIGRIVEGVAMDQTARKKAEEKLRRSREKFRHQATHDNLTGLYNTRYLYTALERLVTVSAEEELVFSLIFMDVDNFKRVVDTYGHLKGSQTLQEMAATIQSSLTEPAFGVAYGGDEFVVVLPDFDKEEAIQKAEDIRTRIRQTAYLTEHGHQIFIRASFGVASFPEDANDVRGLLALADKAMFDVKAGGKDAVRASSDEDFGGTAAETGEEDNLEGGS